MTEQIGTHGLMCLSDDDYAAYALAMQCNAAAADVALTADTAAFGQYLGRPWVQSVSTSVATIDDDQSGGEIGPNGVVGERMGPGGGVGSALNTSYNMDVPAPSTLMPPGIWLYGASINWTLTSATANSYRQLSVLGVRNIQGDTILSTNFTDMVSMRDYQGDGGNNGALNVVGMLDTTGGDIAYFTSFFSHANTASDLTVAAGAWRLWLMYLGSGLSI